MFPRQAPVWWQVANVVQYADWQAAMSWGTGVMTSPARVSAVVAWLALGWVGFRAMRRDARALAGALAVLLVCGTVGVATYLNLKVGASLGWSLMPESVPHEARERDYFFVLGFWAWGCFAGYGAIALARVRQWPAAVGLLAVALPLAGNWTSADRSREPSASAARHLAVSLLASTPRNGVLFADGDNDTYPLWYAQQVEGVRRDVLVVTIPLLPASWYPAELTRRTSWQWVTPQFVSGGADVVGAAGGTVRGGDAPRGPPGGRLPSRTLARTCAARRGLGDARTGVRGRIERGGPSLGGGRRLRGGRAVAKGRASVASGRSDRRRCGVGDVEPAAMPEACVAQQHVRGSAGLA